MEKKVLFLCTGNSCRSQMAEGLCRHFWPSWTVFSAGTQKHGLNQRAVQVMGELGIDISGQSSKTIKELPTISFDLVVTVCDKAQQSCPFFSEGQAAKRPSMQMMHQNFLDPPSLVFAQKLQREEDILQVYKQVRDEIKNFIQDLGNI